ncbi:MAG: zinc ribbon domain-containing protein [Proteobacteria bacterium]|nr:zinc ribbon domain-containing protein [Pseudomonadota bacterium]
MPIFEFRCSGCSHIFEELVFGGKLPAQCPQCGCAEIKKLLSVFSFKSAGGEARSASSGSGCSSCSSKNCSSCR